MHGGFMNKVISIVFLFGLIACGGGDGDSVSNGGSSGGSSNVSTECEDTSSSSSLPSCVRTGMSYN